MKKKLFKRLQIFSESSSYSRYLELRLSSRCREVPDQKPEKRNSANRNYSTTAFPNLKRRREMGKQAKSKKTQVVGKGKVTPVQIAFIVDRYLSDNGYADTRSTFRSEASDLISKSPVHEAPKSLLSLGAILDEYITLKEKKVWVDQERRRLDQEKLRVQNLLVGLQGVMNAYNATGKDSVTSPLPPPQPQVASAPLVPQIESTAITPAGYPVFNGTPLMPTTIPSHIQNEATQFSTPVMYHTTARRKAPKNVLDCPVASKKPRKSTQTKDVNLFSNSSNTESNQRITEIYSAAQLSIHDTSLNDILVQESNVAKCLFNQETTSPPADSPVPKTPTQASLSQTQKSTSPLENCSTPTSVKGASAHILSANCTIISAETIQVTPTKQVSYYSIEQNHISPSSPHLKRSSIKDHVRGRLDFGAPDMSMIMEKQTCDGNSTSESDMENSFPILDFSSLDAFTLDFNLSDLFLDFDVGNEDQVRDSSPDLHSSSLQASGNQNMGCGTTPFPSELPSNLTGYLEKDQTVGPETVSTTRSITKRITIVSPVKSQRSHLDRERFA